MPFRRSVYLGHLFAPREDLNKIDAVYASMHFERIFLPNEYEGTPEEAYQKLSREIEELDQKISACDGRLESSLVSRGESLVGARDELASMSRNFDVRKLAACTNSDSETFYILCGWMAERTPGPFRKKWKGTRISSAMWRTTTAMC